jgi:hypothetical protein
MLKFVLRFLAWAAMIAGGAAAAPTPVASLKAEPLSRSEIRLFWRNAPAAARIVVQRRDAQGLYADIATLAHGATEYVDRRLPSGVRQFYRVRNIDAAGVRGPARGAAGWTYTGPLTITAGGVYSGAWESLSPDTPAVRVETNAPVVIEKSYIRSRGKGIESLSAGADLVVRDTRGIGLDPRVRGALRGCFIDVGLFRSIVMEHNRAEAWACGIRALNFGPETDTRSDQIVTVRYNQFVNIDGRPSDGAGGVLIRLDPSGQAIGMNSVERANARIEWNEVINEPGKSRVEDVISPFQSGGRPGRPILIRNNYLQGGYHGDVAAQVDYTGQGVNLGDCPDGDPDCAYVEAQGNVVVSYANGGVGILGGHHMRAFNNRVVSAQRAPNGVVIGGNFRTGYLYWNFYDNPNWRENYLFNNYSFVAGRDGRIAGDFLPDARPALVFDNVSEGTPGAPPPRALDTRVEEAELAAWRRRARAALVVIGPR